MGDEKQNFLKMVKLIIGDIREVYKLLEDNSIDCVVTSPPYWQQRDYGIDGQIGQENTPEQYAFEISNVFKLLWDKLKKTATIFLNIGYKYHSEEFLLIPEMVAFEMRKLGYVLKNKIIWYKPNAMPTPARNRLNNTYEVVLLFVKNIGREVYYFNLEALAENTLFGQNNNGLKIEDLLSAKVEDNLSSREKKEGVVKAVNDKAIKVEWADKTEQNFEFTWEQEEATFRCVECKRNLNYWDIMLSYANYEKFICSYCKSEELPIPILPAILFPEDDWISLQGSGLIIKGKITNAKGSEKYRKAGVLTSSPAGRLALTGEKILIKRRWIFPQLLIADYLKKNVKKKNLTVEELEKLMGYKYTAGHWLRKDFSYWGKGGSLPRPVDWLKLKEVLELDDVYDRLICDLVAMVSTVRVHPKGKNIGDVWEIPTEPYEGEHFAIFPRKLVERCIKIGCPPNGVVLDPFAGSGTVGEVAKKLGRSAILVEINPDYKKLIEKRCGKIEVVERD
jgi:DNA modification methylase